MKKITEEEAKTLSQISIGKHPVRKELVNMQMGEYMLIDKADLGSQKGNVPGFCRRVEKGTGMLFKCTLTTDKKSYVVQRMK